MRTIFTPVFVFIAAAIIAASIAASTPAQVQPMTPEHCGAEVLPAATIYMLEYRNLSDTVRRAMDTSVYRIFTDPEVAEYLDPHLETIREAIEEMDGMLQEASGISLDEIVGVLDGRLTIALLDLAVVPRLNISAALILTPQETQRLNDLLDKIITEEMRLQADVRTRHGVEINRIGEGAGAVSWAIAANTLVLGVGEGTVGTIIDKMANPGASLFTTPTFASAYNRVFGYNRDFMVYLNTEHIVNMVNALGGEDARNFIAHFNLTALKGIAIAGQIEGDGVEDIYYLHMPDHPQGFPALISPEPADMALLEIVPADATGFALFRLNALGAYDFFINTVPQLDFDAHEEMMENIGEFEKEAGFSIRDDLLAALAGEIILFDIRPPFEEHIDILQAAEQKKEVETIMILSALGNIINVATINDRDRMERALDALTDYILEKEMEEAEREERADMEELRFEHETYRGASLKYLTGIEEADIKPGYAVTDRFVVMAGDIGTVMQIIDRLEDGGESALDSPLWAEARLYIPEDCGGIFVLDISRMTDYFPLFMEYIRRVEDFPDDEDGQEEDVAAAPRIGEPFNMEDFGNMDYPEAIVEAIRRENMILVVSIKSHPREGLAIQGRSPFGAVSLLQNTGMSSSLMGVISAIRFAAQMRAEQQAPPPIDWDF